MDLGACLITHSNVQRVGKALDWLNYSKVVAQAEGLRILEIIDITQVAGLTKIRKLELIVKPFTQ